jgi:hypothetical protein
MEIREIQNTNLATRLDETQFVLSQVQHSYGFVLLPASTPRFCWIPTPLLVRLDTNRTIDSVSSLSHHFISGSRLPLITKSSRF